jgi:hypothetical protein
MSGALTRGYYAGPACPLCGGEIDLSILSAGEQICPRCLRPYVATPFTPPEPYRPPVESLAAAGPDGAVPCGRHAGNAAVASCARCGVFMCTLCRIEADGQELCPACFDRLSAEGALWTSRLQMRDYRGLSLGVGFLGLFCFTGLLTGPLTFYLIYRGIQQRRKIGEKDGTPTFLAAALLGTLQIAQSGFLLWSIVR